MGVVSDGKWACLAFQNNLARNSSTEFFCPNNRFGNDFVGIISFSKEKLAEEAIMVVSYTAEDPTHT